jgi:hypothetical protein
MTDCWNLPDETAEDAALRRSERASRLAGYDAERPAYDEKPPQTQPPPAPTPAEVLKGRDRCGRPVPEPPAPGETPEQAEARSARNHAAWKKDNDLGTGHPQFARLATQLRTQLVADLTYRPAPGDQLWSVFIADRDVALEEHPWVVLPAADAQQAAARYMRLCGISEFASNYVHDPHCVVRPWRPVTPRSTADEASQRQRNGPGEAGTRAAAGAPEGPQVPGDRQGAEAPQDRDASLGERPGGEPGPESTAARGGPEAQEGAAQGRAPQDVTAGADDVHMVCMNCEQPFVATRSDALFCSGACRTASYRRRQATQGVAP